MLNLMFSTDRFSLAHSMRKIFLCFLSALLLVTPILAAGQFIGSKNSDVYHLEDCPSAQRISEKNRVYFKTTLEAEKEGYRPCGKCNPDTLSSDSPDSPDSPDSSGGSSTEAPQVLANAEAAGYESGYSEGYDAGYAAGVAYGTQAASSSLKSGTTIWALICVISFSAGCGIGFAVRHVTIRRKN